VSVDSLYARSAVKKDPGEDRLAAQHDSKLIERLEGEWRDALCRKDIARLQSMLHEDFVLIGTRATGPFMMSRDEWLKAIQRREIDSIEIKVEDATILESAAIGTVKARWRLKYLGRVIEDTVVLTDVWVKDEGRWQAIRRHSTPAPASACIETGE
jgi:ketosteroid isomerase-like protein